MLWDAIIFQSGKAPGTRDNYSGYEREVKPRYSGVGGGFSGNI